MWVPVDDISKFHIIEGYTGNSLQNWITEGHCTEPYENGYDTELQEYNYMKKSVEENKGFYIGRYETGKEDGSTVVKKNKPVYTNVKWGNSMTDIGEEGAVAISKKFAQENEYTSVTSTLCYGVQWDATMQFIDNNYINGTCDENSYVRNSTGKGNYGAIINTGSNEEYAVKNIFDMAGNVWEWTMEVYQQGSRVRRSGYYTSGANGETNPASTRYMCMPNVSGGDGGFRITLYL